MGHTFPTNQRTLRLQLLKHFGHRLRRPLEGNFVGFERMVPLTLGAGRIIANRMASYTNLRLPIHLPKMAWLSVQSERQSTMYVPYFVIQGSATPTGQRLPLIPSTRVTSYHLDASLVVFPWKPLLERDKGLVTSEFLVPNAGPKYLPFMGPR